MVEEKVVDDDDDEDLVLIGEYHPLVYSANGSTVVRMSSLDREDAYDC